MSNAAATPPTPSVEEAFTTIILGLLAHVGKAGALALPLVAWLQSIRLRFIALAGQIAAGTLRAYKSGRASSARKDAAKPTRLFPRNYGWLGGLVGFQGCAYGTYLASFIRQPEMQALLAATPRMARLLRPLCWAMGVDMRVLSRNPSDVLPGPVPPHPCLKFTVVLPPDDAEPVTKWYVGYGSGLYPLRDDSPPEYTGIRTAT